MPHLGGLTLVQTLNGNKTAIKVANKHIWTNLKKLDLSSNKIDDRGAIEIRKIKLWVNLEILDLSKNEILLSPSFKSWNY